MVQRRRAGVVDALRSAAMNEQPNGRVYICPMHKDVRRPSPGVCSHCGMALIPEGARFPMLRHMLSNPMHIVIVLGTMAVVMAAAMMMWK